MESLQELDDMRVTELRDFLRRHGHNPTEIPRLGGTPGPPRKPDLLRAAKEIWHAAHPDPSPPRAPVLPVVQSDPSPPRLPSSHSPSNPFQQQSARSPSTATLRRRLSVAPAPPASSAPPSRPMPIPSHPPVPTSSSSIPIHPPANPPTNNPPRERRRSHVAINPAFSHLFTPDLPRPPAATPAAPVRLSGAADALRPQSRRATLGPDGVPARPRIFSDADARRVPDDSAPPPPAQPPSSSSARASIPRARESNVPSLPTRQPDSAVPASSSAFPPRRASTAQEQRVPRPSRRATRDDTISRGSIASPSSPPAPQRRLLLDLDGYDAEDDPEFEVGEHELREADDLDSDDSFDITDEFIVIPEPQPGTGTYVHSPEQSLTPGLRPRPDPSPRVSDAGDSDAGSTVETDDEIQPDEFADWSRDELVQWLSKHSVSFSRRAGITELASRARGHALFLETKQSDRLDGRGREEEEVIPVTASAARKRKIVAPVADEDVVMEDVEEVEIVEVRPARPRASGSKSTERRSKWMDRRMTQNGRYTHRAAFGVLTATVLIFVMVALSSLYHSANLPYCDTSSSVSSKTGKFPLQSQSASTELLPFWRDELFVGGQRYSSIEMGFVRTMCNFPTADSRFRLCVNVRKGDVEGTVCRPCPKNGICKDGLLECQSGYLDVGGRCAEDQAFSLYADTLASDAAELLASIAGQAACGEDIPTELSARDLKNSLRLAEESRPANSGTFLRRRMEYNPETFNAAVDRALTRLTEEEHFKVELSAESGMFRSSEARMSLKCRLIVIMWANVRSIVMSVAVLVYALYCKLKANRARRYHDTIEKYYQDTLELLRNHKIDFENQNEPHAFVKDVVLRAEIVGEANQPNMAIWKDVEKKVKADARVLQASRKVDGMPSYTYEWAGRRRSSGLFDSASRRGSFGSRASLDSMDFHSDDNVPSAASPWAPMLGRFGLRRN